MTSPTQSLDSLVIELVSACALIEENFHIFNTDYERMSRTEKLNVYTKLESARKAADMAASRISDHVNEPGYQYGNKARHDRIQLITLDIIKRSSSQPGNFSGLEQGLSYFASHCILSANESQQAENN